MPIYEYNCEACNQDFEKLVFKGDDEKVCCPCCGTDNVKKLISASCFMGEAGIGTCSTTAPKGFS